MKIKGTVHFVELETGFWGIKTSDGRKYIPVNMPEQLKFTGRKVEIEAEVVSDIGGLHMWGEYVRIISFET